MYYNAESNNIEILIIIINNPFLKHCLVECCRGVQVRMSVIVGVVQIRSHTMVVVIRSS